MRVFRLGDRALLVDLELDPAGRARRTLAAARALRSRLALADVAVAAGSLLLDGVDPWTDVAPLLAEAAREAADAPAEAEGEAGPLRAIEVVYDGPDLASVAAQARMEIPDLIRLHTGAVYTAEFLGFLPGFAYLGPVPEPLALPRRSTPRPAVAARSVAVAAGFAGVYPATTPGGWHLLGRAPRFVPFEAGRPALRPGDRVRFVAVDDAPAASEAAGPAVVAGGLRVLAAPACATVQDAGRGGRLGEGLPPSGPLDGAAHLAANLAVGNAAGEAAIEIPLGSLEVEALTDVLCSIDGEPASRLRAGERLKVIPCERAVRYLAVAGGIEAPLLSGSRSTLPSARLGGLGGRPLRKGDLLPLGPRVGRAAAAVPPPPAPPSPAPLLLHPGPHLDRFHPEALDILTGAEFTVSRLGDRVGVRLEGPALPLLAGRLDLPAPMVRGAIEVSTDGTPIVLGPDHPVTGGYPVIGALTRASQALLARLRPGHRVRFGVA